MLEWALATTAVAAVLALPATAFIYYRLHVATLKHIEATVQIGGTPVGIARAQTEYEIRRAEQHAQQQKDLAAELKAVADGKPSNVKDMFA